MLIHPMPYMDMMNFSLKQLSFLMKEKAILAKMNYMKPNGTLELILWKKH